MDLFATLKSTWQMISGQSAWVTLSAPAQAQLGESLAVTIEVKLKENTLHVDRLDLILRAVEHSAGEPCPAHEEAAVRQAHRNGLEDKSVVTYEQRLTVDAQLILPPRAQQSWPVTLTLPNDAQPSYAGKQASHRWSLQAELVTQGRNPKSKPHPIHVRNPSGGEAG
ncbi:hypothetical protein Mmc1_3236 [Magnetococcus marinus MC-1]|uniref:Uncharacterized protein n=1 Tax=Magnetococcus marinus (strain ATCC BAA-1437 / JCM 17883 / MC-1) TaxID=156889 RepID=A0LCN3_MAGMM|nr:hypothetical protein [Magnetococcus marinus]ABK45726.1 hypothetical protein Mmc1_3236 [Magnetococcus marinus MC-1]